MPQSPWSGQRFATAAHLVSGASVWTRGEAFMRTVVVIILVTLFSSAFSSPQTKSVARAPDVATALARMDAYIREAMAKTKVPALWSSPLPREYRHPFLPKRSQRPAHAQQTLSGEN